MNPFPGKITSANIKSGLLHLEENALIFFKVFPLDFSQFANIIQTTIFSFKTME